MANLLIGLYENRAEAERVRQELLEHGFADEQIRIAPETTAEPAGERTFWDDVSEFFGFGEQEYYDEAGKRGHVVVRVNAEEHEIDRAAEIMERHGAIDIDQRAEEWRQAGWQPSAAGRQPQREAKGARSAQGEETAIPVTEEQLKVGKTSQQRGGVRVYSRVVEEPVEQDVRLREEHAYVERRPADRPADEGAFQQETIEVSETREEPVVSKEAHVTEEVVVGKEAEEHVETVRENVRRTEVDVEELDKDFREEYQRSYANRGSYEEYQPAYQLGAQLARDDRYRGQDWTTIEPLARREYEQRYPSRAAHWSDVEPAVHSGYDRARSRAPA